MRAIDVSGYSVRRPAKIGPKPRLEWIAVKSLAVDDSYQRPIQKQGRANVAKIAEKFDWRKFAPAIVAPMGGGKRYAIVDGQHRVTAAALNGQPEVPCYVIEADAALQAQCFAAINGQVTRLHSMAVYHAAVAGGDATAVLTQAVLQRAGVEVCRYPKSAMTMKRGETLAPNMFAELIKQYGEDIVVGALTAIVDVGEGNPGWIRVSIVPAYCDVFSRRPELRDHAELMDALDDFDLPAMARLAMTKRQHMQPLWKPLAGDLEAFLDGKLKRKAA